jgi:hypothetical protein
MLSKAKKPIYPGVKRLRGRIPVIWRAESSGLVTLDTRPEVNSRCPNLFWPFPLAPGLVGSVLLEQIQGHMAQNFLIKGTLPGKLRFYIEKKRTNQVNLISTIVR